MHPRLEEELLMQIAAGTDPLTALAALPSENESSVKSSAEQFKQNSSYGWITLAVLISIVLWMLLR